MSVKKLDTGVKIELVDDVYIRAYITEGKSQSIQNKKKVFRETAKHFTKVSERTDETQPNTKELYYKIDKESEKELHLDSFRLVADDGDRKKLITDGLLEMLLLISDGKIYDVELNPLNFVAEDKVDLERVYVKAFYRRDRGLREVTDDWLDTAKKLIGYFLINDTGVNETNFNDMSTVDMHKKMSGDVAEEYLTMIKKASIDTIAKNWFSEEKYEEIKGFPPIVPDYKKPKDVTSIASVRFGYDGEEESYQEDSGEDIDDGLNKGLYKGEEDVPNEDNYEVEMEEQRTKKEGKSSKLKKIFLVLVVFAGLGVGALGVMWLLGGDSDKGTVELPESYYDGMIKSSIQKYADAGEEFDKLTKEELEELGEDEKLTIYITYLKGGEFEKALVIDPEGAETVIMYLNKRDQLSKVKEIKSDLPAINFEKAVIENDYDVVVNLKSEIRDTEVRQENVVEALVMTGELEQAVDYILEKDIKGLEKNVRGLYEKYAKDNDIDKKEIKEADKTLKKLP